MATRRGLTRSAAVALAFVALVACSDGDDDTDSPSATLGTTSTTLSVEAEVEAAYLRSWDVYAEAVLNLDTSRLSEVFEADALDTVVADVEGLAASGARARMAVEHDYVIAVDGDTAHVVDNYVNHSVLLNAESREPIEVDPNERLRYEYSLRKIEEVWKIVEIVRPR